MTECIGLKSHFNQVDWLKNTCFGPLIKMDISISKKKPISQFELFEKPNFVVVFGKGHVLTVLLTKHANMQLMMQLFVIIFGG